MSSLNWNSLAQYTMFVQMFQTRNHIIFLFYGSFKNSVEPIDCVFCKISNAYEFQLTNGAKLGKKSRKRR